MSPLVTVVAKILAILTVIADIGIILFLASALIAQFSKPAAKLRNQFLKSVAPYARLMAFIVAMVATTGSLFYSEVAKFTPCILCWYQRIFMYPQTLLLAMGILKKDDRIADYIMGLSGVGILMAAYHYYIQLGGNKFVPCATVGFSVDCSARFSLEFGYITIPMMSLSAFLAIFLLMTVIKQLAKKKK